MSHELSHDPILRDANEVEGYKVLGPCVLCSKIGQGGMGAVYRGRHVNLEIEVAVKCLLPALMAMDGDVVTRFQREAQLAARVTHQNLVRVYDFGEQAGLYYLIMEFVTGESLRQRVERRGASPVDEAVSIILQAARGLEAAHAEEIVHRDIKPDNILVSRKGIVKVADLGLGRIGHGRRDLTMSMVPMGTPTFMPPEQWSAIGRVGPQGDVWALGATLYFLLAGDSAFGGASLQDVQKQICDAPFPHEGLSDLPSDVRDVLCRCTQREPEARYPSAHELAEELHAVVAKHGLEVGLSNPGKDALLESTRPENESIPAPPPSVIERVRAEVTPSRASASVPAGPTVKLPSSRGRWLAWSVGIAALLVAGLVVVLALEWMGAEIPGFQFHRTNEGMRDEYVHESSGIIMVRLVGGEFEMGSPEDDETAEEDEKPRHTVRLSPFLIAKYEVSQQEWTRIMGKNPVQLEQDRNDELPVVNVSWDDCQEFCREMGLELPTEAQWEYACRAGTLTRFAFGPTLGQHQANFSIGESSKPVRVKAPPSNDFGLHNMHGNVAEWCRDVYSETIYEERKKAGVVLDPVSTDGQESCRVYRGGHFDRGSDACRSAWRDCEEPSFYTLTIGFRPVFNLAEESR